MKMEGREEERNKKREGGKEGEKEGKIHRWIERKMDGKVEGSMDRRKLGRSDEQSRGREERGSKLPAPRAPPRVLS